MKIFYVEIDGDPLTVEVDDEYSGSKGTLPDGRKYLVYRFLLYNDGFIAFRSKAGSMDGYYILLLGISPHRRTESSCIRKIALAPPGVCSGSVFKELEEDLKVRMTKGNS